jgi:hypothetical protein
MLFDKICPKRLVTLFSSFTNSVTVFPEFDVNCAIFELEERWLFLRPLDLFFRRVPLRAFLVRLLRFDLRAIVIIGMSWY